MGKKTNLGLDYILPASVNRLSDTASEQGSAMPSRIPSVSHNESLLSTRHMLLQQAA